MIRAALRHVLLAVLVVLWAAALALPAIRVRGGPTLRGFDVLIRGWQAFDSGVYAWSANPLFLAAALLCAFRLHRTAGVVAGIGCVLALTSFGSAGIAASAGNRVPSFAFQSGFYLWLASQFALLVCCWIWAARTRDTVASKNIPPSG